jgi:hypothetical protein
MRTLPNKITVLFIISILLFNSSFSQKDSAKVLRNRKIFVLGTTAAVTGSSLVYLQGVWYSQYNSGKFHFFNDDNEWYGMDKCGHFYTNFQLSGLMIQTFKWAGFNKPKQLWIGGTLGFGYMTAVEVMDGYSSGWGFSWGDMAANAGGTLLSIGQYALWNEARINLKFSFWPNDIAKYNPQLLGSTPGQQFLKNYNAQTYWLSVSPFAFCKKESKLPKWLAVSFGYGADGMLNGDYNHNVIMDEDGNVINFNRSPQYYFSLDIDFSKIKTRSKVLKTLFSAVNLLKVPFPTLEFQNGKTKFHYLYF